MKLSAEPLPKIQLPSDQDASGRDLGDDEMVQLGIAIESGTLTSTKGNLVKEFEREFAKYVGTEYSFACASGSAAVHCAISAIDPEPSESIDTTQSPVDCKSPVRIALAIP